MVGKIEFSGIPSHDRIKVSIAITTRFRPQNPPQPLRFFLSTPKRPAHLTQNGRIGPSRKRR